MNLNRNVSLLVFLCFFWLYQIPVAPLSAAEYRLKVALYVDRGTSASEFRKEFRNSDDILWHSVDGDDIREGVLRNFDALVVPGGTARKEAASMGADARAEVRRFVNDGGIYMGVCAGAYLASRAREVYLGLLPLKTLDQAHWYRVDDATPVNVELTSTGMEVFGINKSNIKILYENGPIFAPPAANNSDSPTPLGFFRSEVVADDGAPGVMLGAPAMILSRYGHGMVLAISPHPEETPGLKNAEVHALHWLYDHRNTTTSLDGRQSLNSLSLAQPANSHLPEDSSKRSEIQQKQSSNDSKLSEQAVTLAQSIFNKATVVRYIHRNVPASRQINTEPDGTVEARTDCSGLISYIIHSIAPRHYYVVRSQEPDASYPQAKVWAHFFDSLDSHRPYAGWLAVTNWQDLRPGDIIAWEKGASASRKNHNTGHIMLALGKPSALKQDGGLRYFEIPVIDSSTTYHFAPEHLPPNAHQQNRNGLGMGTVRIILSEADAPIAYWAGTYWGEGKEEVNHPTFSKCIRFARMVPNQ